MAICHDRSLPRATTNGLGEVCRPVLRRQPSPRLADLSRRNPWRLFQPRRLSWSPKKLRPGGSIPSGSPSETSMPASTLTSKARTRRDTSRQFEAYRGPKWPPLAHGSHVVPTYPERQRCGLPRTSSNQAPRRSRPAFEDLSQPQLTAGIRHPDRGRSLRREPKIAVQDPKPVT